MKNGNLSSDYSAKSKQRAVLKNSKKTVKNAVCFRHLYRSQNELLGKIIEILLGKHIKMHDFKKESRRSADTVTHLSW